MLSIIIPVYNTEKYLSKFLDSVLNAVSKLNFGVEILLINDGSTDQSEIVIEEYQNRYPDCIYSYSKPNGGLSSVKNYGLDRAKGRYVSFIDSDDYIESEMFSDMMNQALAASADAIVCDIKLVYDNGAERIWSCTNATKAEVYEAVIDMPMMASSCNKIIKRKLFSEIRFPVGINNEDIAVTPIVLGRAKKIIAINKPYYNYYQRSGSIQNNTFSEKRFALLRTAKICIDMAKELGSEKQNIIKNSLYAHQILALALYPIREQSFFKRRHLLGVYMKEINSMFPDFWKNSAVRTYGVYDGEKEKVFKQLSIKLLRRKCYFMVCCFWTVVNIVLNR